MAGLAPLSDTVIESFARLQRLRLEPYEVEFLIHLDAAIREPDSAGGEEEQAEPEATRPRRAWPSRVKRPEDE